METRAVCAPAVAARTRAGHVEDANLASLAAAGNELAFEAIVGRYRTGLLRYAERIVGTAHAEDAVQQALVNAWRSLAGGCEVRELRGWLYAIVHRSALQLARVDRRAPGELPPFAATAPSAEEHVALARGARTVLEGIAQLPEPEREALLSVSVHGHSGRHVAGALGVSEPAVRQLVFRARARLRAAAGTALTASPVPALPSVLRRGGRGLVPAHGEGAALPAPAMGAGKLAVVLVLAGAAATPMLAPAGGAAPPARGGLGHHAPAAAGGHASQGSAAAVAARGATAPSHPGSSATRRGGTTGTRPASGAGGPPGTPAARAAERTPAIPDRGGADRSAGASARTQGSAGLGAAAAQIGAQVGPVVHVGASALGAAGSAIGSVHHAVASTTAAVPVLSESAPSGGGSSAGISVPGVGQVAVPLPSARAPVPTVSLQVGGP